MKAKLRKFESYNALNNAELKDLLRDIRLEMAELKQDAVDLTRDVRLAGVAQISPHVTVVKDRNIKLIEIEHRSSTLNNHAEYILILLARGKG